MGKAISYTLGGLIVLGGAAFAAISLLGDPLGLLPMLGLGETKPPLIVAAQNPDSPASNSDSLPASVPVPPTTDTENVNEIFDPPSTPTGPTVTPANDKIDDLPEPPAPSTQPGSKLRELNPPKSRRTSPAPRGQSRERQPVADLDGKTETMKGRVTALSSVKLPAMAAGPLTDIKVAKGDDVKRGELLAKLDDSELGAQRAVKVNEYKAARTKAIDLIEEKFARASADVAESNVKKFKDSNKRVPGSVPLIEIEKADLEWTKAKLQIEKAQHDRIVDSLTAKAKLSEISSVDVAIEHRQIAAPFDGEVVDIKSKLGEWVAAGETVFELISLAVLNVEIDVPARDYRPGELSNRMVKVEVLRNDKIVETLDGTIVFARPIISNGDTIACTVEVTNRKGSNGVDWVLYPGEIVQVKIGGPGEINGNARRLRQSDAK